MLYNMQPRVIIVVNTHIFVNLFWFFFICAQGNSSAEQRTPRYVKQKGEIGEELIVKGATGNSQPKFDAIGTVDMLKEQNIFIERDLVRLGKDIGQGENVISNKFALLE